MTLRVLRAMTIAALAALAAACEKSRSGDRAPTPTPTPTPAPAPAPTSVEPSEMERAAVNVVAFLQGTLPFERLQLADSVALQIGQGGGGGTTVVPRDGLRRREGWASGTGSRRVSFVPNPGLTRLTTKAGRHFACHEQMLGTQFPRLAAMPHVGTRLDRASGESCLQTWNLTLVFDSTGSRPRVVAVVYDQWEW